MGHKIDFNIHKIDMNITNTAQLYEFLIRNDEKSKINKRNSLAFQTLKSLHLFR